MEIVLYTGLFLGGAGPNAVLCNPYSELCVLEMSRVDNSSSGSLKRGTQLTGSVFIGRQVPFLNKDSKYITYIHIWT